MNFNLICAAVVFVLIPRCSMATQVREDYCQAKDQETCSNVTVPWFPRTARDLDKIMERLAKENYKIPELDHPAFTDPSYLERRKVFAKMAYSCKHGEDLPWINYTEEETQTWRTVYRKLEELRPTHLCQRLIDGFEILKRECNYTEHEVPQLRDVSKFLQARSGFQLRPVPRLVTSRDYLAGLAFRVQMVSPYMRHSARPEYSAEPDVIHELLGHLPFIVDRELADIMQKTGLASLGATDEWIDAIHNFNWYSFELGLTREDGELRGFGGSVLSEWAELENSLAPEAVVRDFNHDDVPVNNQEVEIALQPFYFASKSITDSLQKNLAFIKANPRPFDVRYNSSTESVEFRNRGYSYFMGI